MLESSITCHLLLNEGRRLNHRWVSNITKDHKETGYESVNWIQMTSDWVRWQALVNMGMNEHVTQKAELSNYHISCRILLHVVL